MSKSRYNYINNLFINKQTEAVMGLNFDQWNKLIPGKTILIDDDGYRWKVIEKFRGFPTYILQCLKDNFTDAFTFCKLKNKVFDSNVEESREFSGPNVRIFVT